MNKCIKYLNNIKTTLIKTDKFKTIVTKVSFINHFNAQNATKFALLTRILSNTTKLYNSKKSLNDKLFSMYDASFDITSSAFYKTSVITFTLDVVNGKFVNDQNIVDEAMRFLHELITNPNAENNKFDESVFNEEKKSLYDSLRRTYDKKSRYALKKTIEIMCEGTDDILNVSPSGNLFDLEAITNEDVYQTYLDLLHNSQILIYSIGDFEYDSIFESLNVLSDLKTTDIDYQPVCLDDKVITKVKEKDEIQDLNQSKLVMGYRSKINALHPLYYGLCIFDTMFGGLYSSDLFRIIREEKGLAYSVASQVVSTEKVMYITAGIDGNNYHLVTDLIIKLHEKYKNGEIDEILLQTAKENYIADVKGVYDSPYALTSFIHRMDILNSTESLEQLIDNINNVTVEDVMLASRAVTLEVIFLLTNKEGNI